MRKRNSLLAISFGLLLSIPMISLASTASDGSSGSGCGSVEAAQQALAAATYSSAKNTFQQDVPNPANLQSSTCFSNILNMGGNIGISLINPANILKQLENMACQAAQNALEWPISQAENAINSAGQLPDGLGGVTVSTNNSGSVSTSVNNNASGPSIPSPNPGTTLNSILN